MIREIERNTRQNKQECYKEAEIVAHGRLSQNVQSSRVSTS